MPSSALLLLVLPALASAGTPDRFVELWGEENIIDGVDCDLDEVR